MSLDKSAVRDRLEKFDFSGLFTQELGWDFPGSGLRVEVNGKAFYLKAVAQKRGVHVLECISDGNGSIPEYQIRRKIERQVTKSAYEHLIVFADELRTTQIWQWVARQPSQPAHYREHPYSPQHQSGDALIQKLSRIYIPLNEEEALDLAGATHKLRDAFDRDKVTKKFYDRFKNEHTAFLKFIEGINEQGDAEWYASLMLNRLMFVYFIQCQGFLDGNVTYLQHQLKKVQALKGKGKFLTFYRHFLLTLFHEGFGKQPRDRQLDADLLALLGNVPYLNGGLFDVHELEQRNPKLDIPDEAFERLFAFFDEFDWHLDSRPLRTGCEINPDVLGYIFEKYINQKQMGAYYTKEDITDYISKNTIIPYLFDAAKKQCTIAFEPGSAMWWLLTADPDRYIYPAVRHGVIDPAGEVVPLPPAVAEGVSDLSKRDGWNRPASDQYGLPTETWREHVARRQRCLGLRDRLRRGEVFEINDLITLNLNIRQFAEDVLVSCDGPELLRAFWHAIREVTVLDPTCGSGAFLFAALGILQPLYDACLDRMQAFVADMDRSEESHSPKKFEDFRTVLADVERHPSRDYFILKSMIVRNLYGVDIMPEAVEICKLRLFLKLVAQVDRVDQLEPLPDIDFNIRPGNTLVGFATLDDVKRTILGTLADTDLQAQVDRIIEDAETVDRALHTFHELQSEHGMDAQAFTTAKQILRKRLDDLSDQLDRLLAGEYGADAGQPKKLAEWRNSHQPFHWFSEYFGILMSGGFKVVIGNPPYVENAKIVGQYSLRGLELVRTGNLFGVCTERVIRLACAASRIGVIVPISSVSTPRMLPLMDLVSSSLSPLHVSNFSVRPGKLFVGADMNLTILLGRKADSRERACPVWSTRYNRWRGEFRPFLFSTLEYAATCLLSQYSSLPKVGTHLDQIILKKLYRHPSLSTRETATEPSDAVFYHSGGRYFRKCLRQKLSNEYKELRLDKGWGDKAICLLSSSLYYWLWILLSDCYHVTKRDIEMVPAPGSLCSDPGLSCLADRLIADLWSNASRRERRRADGSAVDEVNFDVAKSKVIIDEIDARLGAHYGLTVDELEYIVNYDAAYRCNDDD